MQATLVGGNLSGACLRNVNFTGAFLRGCDLTGADLTGTNFDGADLREAPPVKQRMLPDTDSPCR